MTKLKKQTFLQGAFILVIANLTVKIIGFFFRVPLTYLLGEDGIGMFNTSYTLYTFMFAVATSGFPIAVSKMVSESIARDNKKEADKIFYIALFLLGAIGMAGAGLLFLFAKPFAQLLGNERAAQGIMAIAPAVFFVAVMSAFRGYFQGRQNMYPTAISEVIEALGKLVIGYFLAAYLMKNGLKYASAGAVIGVSSGTFLGVVYLLIIFISLKFERQNYKSLQCKRFRILAKELIYIAIPVTIGASISSLTNVADLFTIMNRLQSTGLTEEASSALYGKYSGYAVPMFNFPLALVSTLAVSVVPAIASALELGKKAAARASTQIAIRITIMFSLPCAVGLSILANPILALVFNNTGADKLLEKLAYAIVFVSMLTVTNAILQAYGKERVPVINMTIGGIIKVLLNYYFIPIFGIDAAPASTTICYFIIVVLNMAWVMKVSGIRFSLRDFIIKPAIAVAAMAVCVLYAYSQMVSFGISIKLAGIISAALGAAIYFIMLFAVKAFKKEDIELMPKGKELAVFLEKIRFLR